MYGKFLSGGVMLCMTLVMGMAPACFLYAEDLPEEELEEELITRSVSVIREEKPIFPPSLRNSKFYKGYTVIAFIVDTKGNPKDFVVLATTHNAFSRAAIIAVKRWKFEPAMLSGELRESRFVVRTKFVQEGWVVRQRTAGWQDTKDDRSHLDMFYRVAEMHELDHDLIPVERVAPVYPQDMILFEENGKAVIEFFVDPEGQVHAPGVLVATNDQSGQAAMNALVNWRFEPPIKDGKRVWTRAIQPFAFEMKKKKTPEGESSQANGS